MNETVTWRSNATLADVADRLREAPSVLVLTHAKADGDAFGSAMAVARAMRAIDIDARVAFAGPFPDRFRQLLEPEDDVRFLGDDPEAAIFAEPWFANAHALLVVDTGAWSQLAEVRLLLEPRHDITALVDHHRHGDDLVARFRHVEPEAAAAAELVAELARLLVGAASIAALPDRIATPAYLGIATDTGWFRHSSTTPRTMRVVADLLEAGADAIRVRALVEQGDPPARLELMKRALASLTRHANDRVTIMRLRQLDFAEAGASPDDSGGLIDLPQSVTDLRVSVLLTERPGGVVKISMRSKPIHPVVDVNTVAQRFGGGGHMHAAGAKVEGALDEVARDLLEVIEAAIGDAGAGQAS
ncbi:MAG: DHH family phosphoesterase [Planctomycetota bacterium]